VRHFPLLRPNGKPVRLSDLAGSRGVIIVFGSLECPISTSYHGTLAKLSHKYGLRGLQVIVALPTDDPPANLEKEARDAGLTVPVLVDRGARLAAALGATTTPEAALLDAKGHLVYRGRIDDAYTARLKRNARISSHDLRDAIDAFLEGRVVERPRSKAVGCPIVFDRKKPKPGARYTYNRDVAPILQKHCQVCHRKGEAGPFALTTYAQARHWADDIKLFTRSRQMPPWSPAGGVAFRNDRRLSEKEIAVLAEWADSGAPEGDAKDAPSAVKFSSEWRMGKPDLVLEAPDDFHLGPDGPDLFRVFPLPMGLKEDRWVVAFDVKPGNPRVVHHTLHYFDGTGTGRKMERDHARRVKGKELSDRGPGYPVSMGVGFTPPAFKLGEMPKFGGLGGWAPGQGPQKLAPGAGMFLPAGSDFLLQMHYHRDGKPAKDRTRVGLYFAKSRVEQPWQTVILRGMSLGAVIAAGEANHRMKKAIYLHEDAVLHNVMVHMHLLGKSAKVTLTPPGGKPTLLIDIPAWDYRWQETYWFEKPIRAVAGSRLEIVGVFDNSAANPLNPSSPPKDVREGEQTTDEMLYAFFGATSATKPWRFVSWGATPKMKSAAEAKRILAQRIGTWDAETTVNGVKIKGTETVKWALGEKFIEAKAKSASGEARLLAGWDEANGAYRYWYFDNAGLTSDGTGQYDPKTKTIRWSVSGAEVLWKFVDADTFEWSCVLRDGKGKAVYEMRGASRRRK
jgi:peroxiredoxin